MRTPILLSILFALTTSACKQAGPEGTPNAEAASVAPATAAVAEGPDAAARATQIKLNDAIYCLNVVSSGVGRARESYGTRVDPATGPVAEGKVHIGRIDPKPCLDRVTKALAHKPAVADLDAAITAYVAQVNAFLPVMNEAADYYGQDRHLDDGAAKGKELHPALLAGFNAFATADAALRTVVDKHGRAAREADLAALAKDPAARGPYLRGRLLLVAEDLVKLADVPGLAKLDAAAFAAKTAELDTALAELTSHADKAGGDDQRLAGDARPLLKAALALVRRGKDSKPYSETELKDMANGRDDIEGSIPQVISEYNDLIRTANSIR